MMSDKNLKVLYVAAEVVPFAKTGGLADVAGSLPKALTALGNDVRIILPRYKGINWNRTVADFPVEMAGQKHTCIVREGSIEAKVEGGTKSVPVYFIDNYHYFDRDGIYGYWDEAERYAFFSKAVLEMLPALGWQPNVIHCNDWHSGPIPLLLKERYKNKDFYKNIATLFTVHNLLYQGNFPKETLRFLDLGEEYFRPNHLEFFNFLSYMKAGLVYADVINTVSTKYAQEIQTAEYGEGFEGLLRERSHDLYGIVNGINYHEFNPETDPRIFRNYNSYSIEEKKENKFALQKELDLPVEDVPLIGLVSRLVEQKGLDLIADKLEEMMQQRIQLVILGMGEPRYEQLFIDYSKKNPDKVSIHIEFNDILAQRIYAGADMFLMPSKFEPCGLGQLIALRYGTIPIVRATGGLADTIVDYDPHDRSGNGFSFESYKAEMFYDTVLRAVRVFYDDKDSWNRLVKTCMEQDFSWNRSAAEYLEVYDKALTKQEVIMQMA